MTAWDFLDHYPVVLFFGLLLASQLVNAVTRVIEALARHCPKCETLKKREERA